MARVAHLLELVGRLSGIGALCRVDYSRGFLLLVDELALRFVLLKSGACQKLAKKFQTYFEGTDRHLPP